MSRLNKRLLFLAVIIGLISWVVIGCTSRSKKEGIIAEVNGEVITQEEFDKDFELAKKMRQMRYGKEILSQEVGENKTYEDVLKEDLLGTLILDKVINEELEKNNIQVTDEEVEGALKNHYITEFGGEEQFRRFLEDNEISEEAIMRDVKRVLTFEKHKEFFFNEVELEEEEIKNYFNENKDSFVKFRISHILVKTEEEGNRILEKLKNGEDFHTLVIMESVDSESAIQGGDLGYFTKDTILKAYEPLGEAASNLEIGEISELIKTELGYHIILLEDRIDSYEDLKEEVVEELKNKKHNEKILDLKGKADIKIYMDKSAKKE
ncbi:SurA N-terminal domain-containing protein [Tepidimicrobium xylanilyticum]|uniref:peptidylprolyl isomerase n=1 Tax=Tepidimicrobium xylanilyticum TaxID=1123352 RepID=A0A1H2XQ51_9FIRM|nr:SurA N-terminal domain-containing protein [Tepidimicrobium xylanilyticum]GMG97560.1 peptidylprolyl isomerase [Tepidimicrobium xylanilyticum]SDW94963.1 foldase protein PrsA [Tepidimicrobium xylanilyticum]